ncbi:hypothetical protein PAPYR_10921 [Paratrimastix pyriformis]|uniref:Uncharacterized protein n=1 Tax=Paratrimastix pyriformis TaxID=342808 RepID=A0ABQ8U4V4_9EUKA|nr:hypothetical protein PAPYR_10921 [Paratrimastix pyriformis]
MSKNVIIPNEMVAARKTFRMITFQLFVMFVCSLTNHPSYQRTPTLELHEKCPELTRCLIDFFPEGLTDAPQFRYFIPLALHPTQELINTPRCSLAYRARDDALSSLDNPVL